MQLTSSAALPRLSSFLVLAAASAACGVSYGQKVQTASHSPYTGAFNVDGDPGYEGTTSFATRGHSLTLYDTSGLLLSVAGSAGSAVTAKNQAEEAAVRRGAKAGDKYTYEYEVYMPVPDKLTTLSYSWGDTTGVDNNLADGSMIAASYSEIDLTTRPKTWYVGKDTLTLSLGMSWQTWQFGRLGDSVLDQKLTYIGMPIGLSYGHLLLPRVQVEGRLTWDPITLWTLVEGEHHANYTAGLHTSAILTSWLHVEADASYQRIPIEFGDRDTREWTANVNLVLWWKGPKFWRDTH